MRRLSFKGWARDQTPILEQPRFSGQLGSSSWSWNSQGRDYPTESKPQRAGNYRNEDEPWEDVSLLQPGTTDGESELPRKNDDPSQKTVLGPEHAPDALKLKVKENMAIKKPHSQGHLVGPAWRKHWGETHPSLELPPEGQLQPLLSVTQGTAGGKV